jgi:transitional endoplasmic reticulum ATPase
MYMADEVQEINLKVEESKQQDVNRGIARIDPQQAEKLGLETGDVVGIIGTKETAAINWPGYPEDVGRAVIRIDGSIRRNAGVGIDDKLKIRKIKTDPASKVVFAPTEELKIIGGGEQYLSQVMDGRVVTRGDLIELNIMGRKLQLMVTNTTPHTESVIIGSKTKIEISEKPASEVKAIPRVTYEDIGGLGEEIRKVREMIELPMKHPELFERLGVEAPKGVLLHGPPGTGKTLLAKALANETNAYFLILSGPEIMSKFYGESEERLRDLFKEAEENAPSIILIDEIDSIAPKREEVTGEVERRVVAQLLALMDGLESRGKVVVLGATNRVNALDPALRRPGRFDREIEIGVPDRNSRLQVLQIHTRGMPLADDVELEKLADVTHGFVGADLAALTKEGAMRAVRRVLPEIDLEEETIPAEMLEKLNVTKDDFLKALSEMEPSALREVFVESPNVKWNDIGGLAGPKQELAEVVEWPLKYQKLYKNMNAEIPKGILLHGPPGTGKTLLARAVATESEVNFISVKGPELLNKWVGESEKAVRETFRKAKQAAPCIIFFDEIDAITPTRGQSFDSHVTERVISQFLAELDGLEELHGVVAIAATNRLDIIDKALLRPGRFDRMVEVPVPDDAARLEIFKIHLKDKPASLDLDLNKLVRETSGYSGADISGVVNEAVMLAIRDYIQSGRSAEDEEEIKKYRISPDIFRKALEKVKPEKEKKEFGMYT